MKHILVFLYIILSLVYTCQAQQGITNHWIMASVELPINRQKVLDLNFTSGALAIDSIHSNVEFGESSASISDSQGNMLFYTNGIAIFNAVGDTMLNGNDFNPGYATTFFKNDGLRIYQSCLILPLPSSPNQYYIFHNTFDAIGGNSYRTLRLGYSIVDMNLDNGKGQCISKNQTAIADTIGGGMLVATKHGNGRDWWVVTTVPNHSKMYVLLLTVNGIESVQEQEIYGTKWGLVGDIGGQAVFSVDGQKHAKWDNETKVLHILDFDRCTGTLSNHISFTPSVSNPYSSYGLAFSPNSKVLYLNKNNSIEQFDMTATNIAASATIVATSDGFVDEYGWAVGFGYACSLAPDGKIYTNSSNPTRHLNVIDNPDVVGTGCNVMQHSIKLPFWNGYTMPVFPNYSLGAMIGSACDTLTSNTLPFDYAQGTVQLYPNPTSSFVTLSISPFSKGAICHFYSTLGECVKNVALASEKTEVFVGDLPEGVYFYEVSSATTQHYGKFIRLVTF